MSGPHFEIRSDGDETEEVWLNGTRLLGTNHDEHGWAGMELVRELVRKIAEHQGGTFRITETEEDEQMFVVVLTLKHADGVSIASVPLRTRAAAESLSKRWGDRHQWGSVIIVEDQPRAEKISEEDER